AYYSRSYHRFGYPDRGRYAEVLEHWFEYFPRERILILKSEEFYLDTGNVYRRIVEFLGVRLWIPDEFPRRTVALSGTQSKPLGLKQSSGFVSVGRL
ncbi:MAG: sulfotransferase domain-containing protein, partial [Acidimicrobiia bacterium]